MSTTTGHIKAIITADNAQYMAKSRETRTDAKTLKADVERQKPKIDADEKPFVAAIARAEAAQAGLTDKLKKTVADLQVQVSKAGDAEANALGRVRVAQAQLDAVRDQANAPAERLAAADERLAAAQRALAQAQQRTITVTQRHADANDKLAAATAAAADATEESVEVNKKAADSHDKAAKSAGDHAKTIAKVAGAMLGANAAMLVGAVAAGAAVGVLPVVAVAAAAVLLSSNAKVRDSYADLADGVVTEARAMAAPLEDDLVRASDDLAASWKRLRPEMSSIFKDSQPAVRELTRGVTEFAENAVPGMATAVSRSEPVMVGWRKFLSDTGQGFGDFFRNVSTDTESTGRNLAAFGDILRSTLGGVGTLLQTISSNFAPYADDFARVWEKIISVVTKFTSGALPPLMSSLGVALDVLGAVLGVVEPIADELGTLTGVVLSAAAAWKVYTAAIALVSKIPLTSALTTSAAAAAPAGGILSRLGLGAGAAAAGTGALAGATSALGISLAATGLIMGAYLFEQQKVDQFADEFVMGITKGGEAAQNVMDKYKNLSASIADLTAKRDAWNATDEAKQLGGDDAIGGRMNDEIHAMQENVDAAKKAWDDYLASVGPVEAAQGRLNLAIAQYGKDSPQATAAAEAYRGAVAKQEAASRDAADAVKTHTDRMAENLAMTRQAAGASLDYDAALLGLETAQKNLNDAVAQHGPTSLEARTADNAYQQQLLATVDAIGEKVAAENAHKSAAEITTLVTQAEYAEILRLAGAAGDNAPAALQKMISSMDGAALAAMGVTVKVDETGQAILTMPDGKQIKIDGDNAAAMRAIQEVNDKAVFDKTLYINAVDRASSKIAASNGVGGMNDGGWVPGNGPDKDDRMVPLTSREFVVNRRAAAKWGPFLEQINSANGGDVKMPDSGLPDAAALALFGAQVPATRMPVDSTSSRSSNNATTPVQPRVYNITLNSMRTLPSPQELRNVLRDLEMMYG
ncbi:hypothetical protein [Umezawaea tangerina]|uniref:Uncharacterized protein n=1 Tax=Umezawaea tangerina TaxID=84725 RepID=A0A2T0TCC7_9PSEU|nr:hypothetical protein [Umezawaea tangerina]PRY43313.1 hypothetical protein CLV43_10353 [Umezawaea tangerina]